MKNKRLYRSIRDRQIAGVCGGIADYFNVDPILVRIVFIIVALAGGSGVLAYFILWIVVPRDPEPWVQPDQQPDDQPMDREEFGPHHPSFNRWERRHHLKHRTGHRPVIGGLVLVTLGILLLLDSLVPNLNFHQLWPILLIVIGGALITVAFSPNKNNSHEL